MGGGLAIGVSCNNVKVKRVIADAPYTDLETIKTRLKEVKSLDKNNININKTNNQ